MKLFIIKLILFLKKKLHNYDNFLFNMKFPFKINHIFIKLTFNNSNA